MIKSNNGTQLVGSIFSFDFGKASLSRGDVKTAMINSGLDEKELPDLSARSDFRRAISQYFRENKSDNSLTFVSSDKNFIYFQINREVVQSNAITDSGTNESVWIKEKEIDPQIKVVYDINANRVIINDDYSNAEDVKSKLYELIDAKSGLYNKAEVTTAFIRNIVKFANGVPIIRGQKVYFVPESRNNILDKVESALKEIDPTVYISRWEAPAEPRVIQSVTNSVVEKMQNFNDGYKKQIEKFIEESKQMSPENVQKKMNEIEAQSSFLESYRAILESETDILLKNLDATKSMLEQFNRTGDIINPYLNLYKKIKAKGLKPEEESEELKDWIPEDYLDDLIANCADD